MRHSRYDMQQISNPVGGGGGTVGRPAESPGGWNLDQKTSKISLIRRDHQPWALCYEERVKALPDSDVFASLAVICHRQDTEAAGMLAGDQIQFDTHALRTVLGSNAERAFAIFHAADEPVLC